MQLKRLITIICLPIIILSLVWSVQKASAQSLTTLTVVPASQTGNIGDLIIVQVNLNNGTNIGGYQFDLNFNPAVLQFQSRSDESWLSSTGRTLIPLTPQVDNTNGKVTLGAATFGSGAGPDGSGNLVTVTFTSIAPGSSPLNLTAYIVSDISGVAQTAAVSNGSVSISSPVTPTPTPSIVSSATLSISGQTAISMPNPVTLDLNFSTTVPVSGVDAVINFDPAFLEIDSVNNHNLLPQTPGLEIDNAAGQIRLSQLAQPTEGFTGAGIMAGLVFIPIKAGQTTLTFSYTNGSKVDSNAIAKDSGNDILTAPGSFNLTINQESYLSLSVRTYSENVNYGFSLSGTTSTITNSWNSPVDLNTLGLSSNLLVPGNMAGVFTSFYFKAPNYLREQFSLTIAPGINAVDLGLLRPGDFNDDGIINSVDLSVMYTAWFRSGNADLNRDGVINSADYWILSQNFLQTDE